MRYTFPDTFASEMYQEPFSAAISWQNVSDFLPEMRPKCDSTPFGAHSRKKCVNFGFPHAFLIHFRFRSLRNESNGDFSFVF